MESAVDARKNGTSMTPASRNPRRQARKSNTETSAQKTTWAAIDSDSYTVCQCKREKKGNTSTEICVPRTIRRYSFEVKRRTNSSVTAMNTRPAQSSSTLKIENGSSAWPNANSIDPATATERHISASHRYSE